MPSPYNNSLRERYKEAAVSLLHQMIDLSEELYPEGFFELAQEEFKAMVESMMNRKLSFDLADECPEFFVPWALYDFPCVRQEEFGEENPQSVALPLLEMFSEQFSVALPKQEQEFLKALLQSPWRFVEVLDCSAGEGLHVKDIHFGEEFFVSDVALSNSQPVVGTILFVRPVQLEKVCVLEGIGRYPIGASFKNELLNLVDLQNHDMNEKEALLFFQNFFVADYSLVLELRYFSKNPREILNTDGEFLRSIVLDYRVEIDILEAFSRLRDLAKGVTKKALENDFLCDDKGQLAEIAIPWRVLKNSNPVVLGEIVLNPGRMVVLVDSQERAERIKGLIERRLGTDCQLLEQKYLELKDLQPEEDSSSPCASLKLINNDS